MNQFKSTTFFLEISRDVLLNLLKTVLTKFAIKKSLSFLAKLCHTKFSCIKFQENTQLLEINSELVHKVINK